MNYGRPIQEKLSSETLAYLGFPTGKKPSFEKSLMKYQIRTKKVIGAKSQSPEIKSKDTGKVFDIKDMPFNYDGYKLIEQYINPTDPTLEEVERREKVVKHKKWLKKQRILEGKRSQWEDEFGKRTRIRGSGIERTEGEIEELQTQYEQQYGIGLWQIGDSFIVQ